MPVCASKQARKEGSKEGSNLDSCAGVIWIYLDDCVLVYSRIEAAWWVCTTANSTSQWRSSLWKPEIRHRNTGHRRAVEKRTAFIRTIRI